MLNDSVVKVLESIKFESENLSDARIRVGALMKYSFVISANRRDDGSVVVELDAKLQSLNYSGVGEIKKVNTLRCLDTVIVEAAKVDDLFIQGLFANYLESVQKFYKRELNADDLVRL